MRAVARFSALLRLPTRRRQQRYTAKPTALKPMKSSRFRKASDTHSVVNFFGESNCRLTHKFAKTGRYASEEENGEDMCQIQAPISFREFKKIVWERAKQGCRLGKVERGSQGAKGCKVTQFHRDPSIEIGDDEHQFYSLDTIILALRSMNVGIRPRRKTTSSPLEDFYIAFCSIHANSLPIFYPFGSTFHSDNCW